MRIGIYVILAAFFGMLQIGIASAAQTCYGGNAQFHVVGVTWGNSTQHISAGPGGMDVPLTVTMQVSGTNCTLTNVDGELEVYGGFSNANGTSAYPNYYMSQITPSSMFSMTFYLNIAKNVSVGPETVENFYLYLYYNTTNTTTRYSQSVNVGIPMRGTPDLVFNTKNGVLEPGLNNLTIEITNYGSGGVANVSVSISSSQISVLSQPIGTFSLAAGASRNLSVLVFNPSSTGGSPITIALEVHYISPYGYATTQNSQLNLYGAPAQQYIEVYPTNATLVSGIVENKSIIVENTGSVPIYNVSVSLTPSTPLYIISRNSYSTYAEIPANSEISIPIEIYSQASSSSTIGSINVALTYTLNGLLQSISRTITFLTPGYINLTQVSVAILPASPTAGSIFTITPTLTNLGSVSAQAVSVTPHPPNGIVVEGENTTFLGNIAPDTPTAFTLSFLVSPMAKAGMYSIPVTITYLNNLNQKQNTSFTYDVRIGVSNFTVISGRNGSGYVSRYRAGAKGGESTELSWIVGVAILCIAVGLGAYYFHRRKKSRVRAK